MSTTILKLPVSLFFSCTDMRKYADLDELIQLFEQEKKSLKKLIKENLAEGEYRVAHRYSKGLADVMHRLEVLYHFQDPYKSQRKSSIVKRSH